MHKDTVLSRASNRYFLANLRKMTASSISDGGFCFLLFRNKRDKKKIVAVSGIAIVLLAAEIEF